MSIQELLDQQQSLVLYMEQKIKAKDWHAVSDAANDLREIDRELRVRKELDKNWNRPFIYEPKINIKK